MPDFRWAGRIAEAALFTLAHCLRLLRPAARLWLGRRLGDLAYRFLPGRRALARENLALAFGRERTPQELERLCRESFRHLGMTAVEVLAVLPHPSAFRLARVDVGGMEHLRSAMGRGKGALMLTAHLGNWELLAPAHVLTGYPLSVVARPLDFPVLDRLVTRFRERSGAEVVAKRRALPEMLAALRRQRMVAVLLDQNATRREGVFVPFFGRPASTSKSLALLALRSGAPVVPVFICRETDGSHRVVIEPEIPPPRTGNRRADILGYTAAFTRSIEGGVRRWPEQWFWMHARWRTRPPAGDAVGTNAQGAVSG